MAVTSKISPILADLSQDIAGVIPLDLIVLWNTSRKSQKKQRELLQPFMRKGIVVSSDSAGLSKLSAQKTLMEVMQLVSEPKEVIYGYGKAVGGEAVGMWVADNTQMFYPESVHVEDIVHAMLAAQREIKDLTVQVGMGVHYGNFLEIGGGLYGNDAHLIESLTENDVEGGDIAITHTIRPHLSSIIKKSLESHPSYKNAFLIRHEGEINSFTKHLDSKYPYPFDDHFFEFLTTFSKLSQTEREIEYKNFAHDKIVILLKINHPHEKLFLDEISGYIVANTYINTVLKMNPQVHLVKSNGDLGIFVSDNEEAALSFTKDVFDVLRTNEFNLNAAVTKGEVLLFKLKQGFEIAGGPVNVASKLAEDSGEMNKIFVEEAVKVKEKSKGNFSFMISRVEIKGSYI